MADTLRQRNKRTGEVRISTDGGLTWQSQGIQTRGPDLTLPARVSKGQTDARIALLEERIKTAEANAAGAKTSAELQTALADLEKTRTELKILQQGGNKLDPAVRQKAIQQYSYSKQLEDTANQLEDLYNRGPGKTKGVMGTADYLPLASNKNFDVAANKSRGIVGQTLGFTGGQLNTPQEAEKAVGPYIPEASDYDSTIVQKIQSMRDLAKAQRENAIQTLGGEPDENGNIAPLSPQQQPTANNPLPTPELGLNGRNQTRAQIDPMLRALGGKVGQMISAGVPDAQILDTLRQSGVDPASTNIGQALQFRQTDDFKRWQRANPGQPYPLGDQFYTKQVPVSAARRLFNKTAATDAGGAVAAGIVGAGNAVLGDRGASIVGAINGDPAMAKLGMDTLRNQHPLASLAGDIAGQALVEAAPIPGFQALQATKLGRRATDLGYGIFSGSGDDSGGDPLTGGLVGGAMNMAGGMAGRSLQRGVGRTMAGVRDAQVGYLANQGIPLTPGRIGRGSENIAGHALGGIEERLVGLPGFDAVIGAARRRGDQAFNSAAFRQAGGTGATGAAGLSEINALKGKAYSFLDGTSIPIDAQFAGRNAAVRASIPDMPGFGNEVGSTLNQLDKVAAPGVMTGRDWQSSLGSIRGDRASIAGQPFASNAATGMSEVESNLLDLAARQGPAGTLDNLNGANRLNAQAQTLAAALDKGPVQRNGQLFSAQNLDDASRLNTRKFGGRMASLTGNNRPFYELSQAGLDVMPNLTPDSGTAGRLALIPLAAAVPGGIGAGIGALASDDRAQGAQSGGEIGTGGYLGALTLAGLMYSKPGQKILQKALIGERSKGVVKLGDYLINNTATASKIGSGLARGYNYTLADLLQ